MALSTISIINVSTVNSTYSWDDGIPSSLQTKTPETGTNIFKCYAPCTHVTVKSNITNESTTIRTISAVRSVSFNDYYNTEDSNVAVFKSAAYLLQSSPATEYTVGLNALSTNDIETVGFFHTYVMPGTYKINIKTSLYNETEEASLSEIQNGVYMQQAAINKQITMEKQISTETTGVTKTVYVPVVEIKEEIVWDGTIEVLEIHPTIISVEAEPHPLPFTEENFNFNQTTRKRLSVKNSKAGSFPIERVVWEMSDGTIYEQVRWNIITDPSKYVANDWYTLDPTDPRKYDVIHDFIVNPDDPTKPHTAKVTIYSANTNSSATQTIYISTNIGTANSTIDPNKIDLIKCEMTDNGKVFVGKIDNSLVMWSKNK